MEKETLRKRIGICNIIIAVLSALCIATYFFMPFWKISVSYNITAPVIEDTLNDLLASSDGESSEQPVEDLNIDATEIVGTEGVTLTLSVRLKTADVLASLGGDSVASVQNLIDDNVTNAIDELYPTLSKVVNNATKVTFKTTIYSTVRDKIKESTPDADAEEVERILDNAGITEEYINTKIEDMMGTIENGAPISTVSQEMVDAVDDACNKLNASDPEHFDKLSEADKEEVRKEIEEVLETIADKNGEINLNEYLAQIFLNLLGDEESGNDGEVVAPASYVSTASEPTVDNADISAVDELKIRLTDLIMDEIPANTAETIALVMKIVSGVFFFTAFTWLYLIIKILAKIKKPNNAIKLKLPIWLGWLPCSLLVFLPALAFSLLNSPSSFLVDIIGADAMGEITKTLSSIDVSFSSAGIISFAVAMALAIFSIAYYGRMRRKLRKIVKAEKASGKVASTYNGGDAEEAFAPVDYKSDDYDPDEVDMDGYDVDDNDNYDE